MKQLWNKIKPKKIFLLLLGVILVFCLLGTLYIALLNQENKNLVTESLKNFFQNIQSEKINYQKNFFISTTNNVFITFFIWIIGISIIGIPFIIITLAFKSFIVGFSFSSIIYNYGILGIPKGIIYIIPHIIGLFSTFILSYYAISFSLMLFKLLFRKQDYAKKAIMTRYIKILIFAIIFAIFSSSIETFVVPALLKLL